MEILLLGATGRTGKHILHYAITQGHRIHCLVRYPEKIAKHKQVTIIKGNPLYIKDLKMALINCSCIISALNISRVSDFPWSKLRTPPHYLSNVMENIISCVSHQTVDRIVICSAWGVAESRKDIPKWFKWLIDLSNIGVAYKDHERQENSLKRSSFHWTIVRPVALTNTQKAQKIKVSFNNFPKPSLTISRKSTAKYLVDSIQHSELIGKTVVISTE